MKNPTLTQRLAAASLGAAVLLAPVTAAPVIAAPSSTVSPGAGVIVPGREIGLSGTTNTRVLAGYRTTDGRVVNNRILRSDNLSKITAADKKKLKARKLGAIIDLRTAAERTVQKDLPIAGTRWVGADILGGVPPVQLVDLPQAYASFVTDKQARDQFRTAILNIDISLKAGHTPLYHCSAGKDRTGWLTVIILKTLGVDDATIKADFLASNHYRHANPQNPLDGVQAAYLNRSYSEVRKHYGTFTNYLTKGLKLTPNDLNTLRSNLLG
ncbi:MAG: tyrosine-protein phosphatase [Gordonia sp. (in: high G+C Gram-positive bacteria)]|uniref:tyrosine-protein phosphatase n=1 Tax=Gordonia sp. (in: high G+C Gram-positive bacteria) TaxID=84139 RepID=UPI0039E4AF6C